MVFLGGGVGSVARYLIGRWITGAQVQIFPWGTFVVNIIACLIMGLLLGWMGERTASWPRMLLVVGFCGGFSTFSAFSAESLQLLQRSQHLALVLYIAGSVVLCIAATATGVWLSSRLTQQ